jgi:hypothetical protein
MGEKELAAKAVEHPEVVSHWFKQARHAIAIPAQREELAAITGPVGPRLSSEKTVREDGPTTSTSSS